MTISICRTQNMNLIHLLDSQVFDYTLDSPVDTTGAQWWVALDGNIPVAYAGLKVLDNGYAYLCRAGVLAGYRGRNLQSRLIRVRVAWAKKQGCSQAITYTVLENPASSNNLIKCGFKLYIPEYAWGGQNRLYWSRKLEE
jgi:GNAT superfamily N-acetyltransferase